jgi:asparagine synthase (glutamine-hydrolysing)
MCGIAGSLSWTRPVSEAVVRSMTAALQHRGPDAEGFLGSGPVCLGHRRLAVIDPSDAGRQPMRDASGRFAVTYNGEIYNFLSLRKELENRGASFRTKTDTEVLLEAYKHWGAQALERLNGMFAFAIWDDVEQTLFLARDRLGKKPLFYHWDAERGLTFASELPALLLDPAIERRWNWRALNHFLSMNYVLNNECIVEGITKLPPAHYLLLRRGGTPIVHRYWDLAPHFRQKQTYRSEGEMGEALDALIADAVRLRMIADVPLGAFLSSGIDSATAVAHMIDVAPPARVETFSIDFEEPGFSEAEGARRSATHFGVNHHERTVRGSLLEELPSIVARCGEPFADSSMVPMYFLSRFAREGVTVALSGDGGDELFAGYETYTADRLRQWTAWVPAWLTRLLASGWAAAWPASHGKVGWDYKVGQFLAGHGADALDAHFIWRQILPPGRVQRLLRPEIREAAAEGDPRAAFRGFYAQTEGAHYLDRLMHVDISTWLVDDILVKLDRTSMAHSLEARAPFLDYRLVEFAASLPAELKMKGLRKKYLLRRSQRHRLPAEVVRRRKLGFNAPVARWFAGPTHGPVAGLTAEELAGEWFVREEIEMLVREHRTRRRDHGLALLGLVNLFHWRHSLPAPAA